MLWEDKLHYKPPKCGSEYFWHCDYNMWLDERTEDFLTVMIHLENSTKENGALSIIPKSHLEYEKYKTNKDAGVDLNLNQVYLIKLKDSRNI